MEYSREGDRDGRCRRFSSRDLDRDRERGRCDVRLFAGEDEPDSLRLNDSVHAWLLLDFLLPPSGGDALEERRLSRGPDLDRPSFSDPRRLDR